jgi:transcriptional regulator with XRE-family HTH domain
MKYKSEQNIKAERIRKGFTQRDMALKIGISANSYGLKERGIRSFDLNEFKIICQTLNCEPNALVNF